MSGTKEYDFDFMDSRKRPAHHRVSIYACDSWTAVVATDRSEKYHCASVTNSIENLINALIAKEGLDPERLVIIEAYDDLDKETFDLVKFDRMRDGTLHFPSWKAITKEQVMQWCGKERNDAA